MAKTKPGPDGNRFGTRCHEAPCHEVNGRYVVGIESVPQAESIRQEGRGGESCMRAEDDGYDGPYDKIY